MDPVDYTTMIAMIVKSEYGPRRSNQNKWHIFGVQMDPT